jgi:hypothetical protein
VRQKFITFADCLLYIIVGAGQYSVLRQVTFLVHHASASSINAVITHRSFLLLQCCTAVYIPSFLRPPNLHLPLVDLCLPPALPRRALNLGH